MDPTETALGVPERVTEDRGRKLQGPRSAHHPVNLGLKSLSLRGLRRIVKKETLALALSVAAWQDPGRRRSVFSGPNAGPAPARLSQVLARFEAAGPARAAAIWRRRKGRTQPRLGRPPSSTNTDQGHGAEAGVDPEWG